MGSLLSLAEKKLRRDGKVVIVGKRRRGPGGLLRKENKGRVVIRTSDTKECWQAELGSGDAVERQWRTTPLGCSSCGQRQPV